MENYVITYYVPNEHNELVLLAKAVASGENVQAAALKAYAALQPDHPTIIKGYWLGSPHRGSEAS